MNIKLSRLQAIAKATSKDTSREALTKIHICGDIMEATDGYILVREHGKEQLAVDRLLDPADFTPFKSLKDPIVDIEQDKAVSQTMSAQLKDTSSISYPPTSRVLPELPLKDSVTVTLSATLLKKLCEVVLAHQKAMGSKMEVNQVIEFTIQTGEGADRKPVLFKAVTDMEVNGVYLNGAIMPFKK